MWRTLRSGILERFLHFNLFSFQFFNQFCFMALWFQSKASFEDMFRDGNFGMLLNYEDNECSIWGSLEKLSQQKHNLDRYYLSPGPLVMSLLPHCHGWSTLHLSWPGTKLFLPWGHLTMNGNLQNYKAKIKHHLR